MSTNRIAEQFPAAEPATTVPNIRGRLVERIRESLTIGDQINKLQQQLLTVTGGQSELWDLFLADSDLTRQQAMDENYMGLKDAFGDSG